MTTLRQAAEQIIAWYAEGQRPTGDDIVDTLREALAQPEQEPVAKVYRYGSNSNGEPWHGIHWFNAAIDAPDGTLLYLHPAPIPEGWQLVPKEPTINMLNALYYSERSKGYAAMLAAAPKYREQEK